MATRRLKVTVDYAELEGALFMGYARMLRCRLVSAGANLSYPGCRVVYGDDKLNAQYWAEWIWEEEDAAN